MILFLAPYRNSTILYQSIQCTHILENFPVESMFGTARECTLTKRNLACIMMVIIENAVTMTLLQGDGSLVQLQEARVPGFSFLKQY